VADTATSFNLTVDDADSSASIGLTGDAEQPAHSESSDGMVFIRDIVTFTVDRTEGEAPSGASHQPQAATMTGNLRLLYWQ
jgi:hypothetical protein